jgi:ribose/xylose/arabinose/galactoside ABC-type transport system permease subunit
MSEEADETLGVEVTKGVLSLSFGLFVPGFFNALTQSRGISVYLIVFACFAACILYGEVGLSVPSGAAFGFGMLLTSFAAQNWWLCGLAMSAVAVNLASDRRLEPSAIELEDTGLDPSADPS